MRYRKALLKKQSHSSGQGMTEYLIIVALIAVSAIIIYRLLGSTIQNKTAALALSIAEQDNSSAESEAKNAANSAAAAAKNSNKLSQFEQKK